MNEPNLVSNQPRPGVFYLIIPHKLFLVANMCRQCRAAFLDSIHEVFQVFHQASILVQKFHQGHVMVQKVYKANVTVHIFYPRRNGKYKKISPLTTISFDFFHYFL